MKRFIILLALLLTINSLYAKKYAFIVGMPSGFKGSVRQGINIDIKNMNNIFSKYGFDIIKLTDPTTNEFRVAMKSFQKLTPNDTFIFYYTGHGAQTEDKNGDEEDGRDEVIVLKDFHINRSLSGCIIDDEMYNLLSKIDAKKYVFFDSCHSGTAFKFQNTNQNYQTKTLEFISGLKHMEVSASSEKGSQGSLVFMGAAEDTKTSIATSQGSIFTNALVDGLKRKKADLNKDGKIKFQELLQFTRDEVKRNTRKSSRFTPQLYAKSSEKSLDILSMLNSTSSNTANAPVTRNRIQNNTNTNRTNSPIRLQRSKYSKLEQILDKVLKLKKAYPMSVSSKKNYYDGDLLTLDIDANGQNGYLYIIYSDTKTHTLLYPNKYVPKDKINSGTMQFPKHISRKLKVRVQAPYGRVAVFTILSPIPLNLYKKDLTSSFNEFNHNSKKSKYVLRQIIDVDTTVDKLLIGKTIFNVREGI